jgi:phosphatidylglycerophosphate synthase
MSAGVSWNIANVLSAFRLGSAPLLLVFVAMGQPRWYLGWFAVALATDFFDGQLARRLNLRTEFGAKLDLWGDAAVLLTLPVAFAVLWPQLLWGERWFVAAALVSYATSAAVAFRKFGGLASYHTWLGKAATLALAVGAIVAMAGWATWPLRLGIVLITAAILEEIVISILLKEARTDVPSPWHVWGKRGE